jgi:hypothetical protein
MSEYLLHPRPLPDFKEGRREKNNERFICLNLPVYQEGAK